MITNQSYQHLWKSGCELRILDDGMGMLTWYITNGNTDYQLDEHENQLLKGQIAVLRNLKENPTFRTGRY